MNIHQSTTQEINAASAWADDAADAWAEDMRIGAAATAVVKQYQQGLVSARELRDQLTALLGD